MKLQINSDDFILPPTGSPKAWKTAFCAPLIWVEDTFVQWGAVSLSVSAIEPGVCHSDRLRSSCRQFRDSVSSVTHPVQMGGSRSGGAQVGPNQQYKSEGQQHLEHAARLVAPRGEQHDARIKTNVFTNINLRIYTAGLALPATPRSATPRRRLMINCCIRCLFLFCHCRHLRKA